jgi:Rieske Fe-S protein
MMNRREFVKITCTSCMGTSIMASMLASCATTHYVEGTMESNGIAVAASEFKMTEGSKAFREYIIVRNDRLEVPICVYRFSDSEYTALLMKCTHQGTELQAAGDHLHCSAHGSEFDNRGKVSQGPAEQSLRTFNVMVNESKLLIELK